MKKITIKDLAAETNLSITQVSKALNGYPDVSATTKKLVIAKASELGYVPNKGARSLASKKQTEITVINLNLHSVITENIFLVLNGIYAEAEKHNMKVSVDFVSNKTAEAIPLANYLIQNSIENPIIIGLNERHPYYKQISDSNFKYNCIVLDNKITKDNVINVNVDDNLGVQLVCSHLKEMSYSKVLVVGSDLKSFVTDSRTNAVINNFPQYDLSFKFIYGQYDYEQAKAATIDFKNDLPKFDAVFCFSDIMAVGVSAAMHELGISRPIIGFDGLQLTNYVYPKISTVSQSFFEKGVKIVEVIVAPNQTKQDILVTPVFIKR